MNTKVSTYWINNWEKTKTCAEIFKIIYVDNPFLKRENSSLPLIKIWALWSHFLLKQLEIGEEISVNLQGRNVTNMLSLQLTWSLASSVCGIVAEMRQIHMDWRVLRRKKDGTATLSRGECPELLPWQAFIGLICTGIQGVCGKLTNHCQAVIIK